MQKFLLMLNSSVISIHLIVPFLLIFFLSSCKTQSIGNPYKQPQGKPKPCKCGTKNNTWASRSVLINQAELSEASINSHIVQLRSYGI